MTLYELLERSSDKAITIQAGDGSMLQGHNGPYRDPETPLRNTAHWSITLLKAYEISGKKKYREAADRSLNYLSREEHRPSNATFICRKNPKKDLCNGLIGQAWIIEALIEGGITLEMPELIILAEEIFLLHPFNKKYSVWHRVEVDGRILSIDMTFNHQLWFAAAGALLSVHANQKAVFTKVRSFMDNLDHSWIILKYILIFTKLE